MATKDNVQGVVLALFGASAGGHLAGLTATATANGLSALAGDLAASAGFILGTDLSTNAAFRDHFLSGLGISSTNSAYTAAAAWANAELAKPNANRGEIVASAVNYLAGLTDTTSPFYAAATAYKATVAAAVTWSEGAGATVFGVSALQAQQGGSGGNGQAFTLDAMTDLQDFSAFAAGVQITIAGDDTAVTGDKFNVTGTAQNDTVILDTYLRADVDAGAGVDTLDLTQFNGTLGANNADVNLQTGVAHAQLLGTFRSFENVIANDQGGRLVGTTEANKFTLGEGVDDISAAGGDDTIVADGNTFGLTDVLVGGSGTDTLIIDGESTLTLADGTSDFSSIENIEITGTDKDDVTLTMDELFSSTGSTAITDGVRNVKITDAGDKDTVHKVVVDATGQGINLVGVTFTNVEELDLNADNGAADTGVITIDANSLKGVTSLTGDAGDALTLTGGTYDFSAVDFATLTEIAGSATKDDVIKFGADLGDIVTVGGGASIADEISFINTDVGDISAVAVSAVETLTFGSASSVVMDNNNGGGDMFSTITGNAGGSSQLTVTGGDLTLTSTKVTNVDTIVLDNGGTAVAMTVGASTLTSGTTVIGDSGTDSIVMGADNVDLTGIIFKDIETLDLATKVATSTVAAFSTFKYIDGDDAGKLTFTDSGAVTLKTASTTSMTGDLTVQFAAENDTVTLTALDDNGQLVTLKAGSGNDTVTVSGTAVDLAASKLYLQAGDDVFSAGNNILAASDILLADGGTGTDTIKSTETTIANTDLLVTHFTGFETFAFGAASTAALSFTGGANTAAVKTIDYSADTSSAGANTINLGSNATLAMTVIGSAGADTITSTAGGDTINGGAGNDTIKVTGAILATAAEKTSYTLTGGAGTDTFEMLAGAFTTTVGQHSVTITDFGSTDKLDVDAITATAVAMKQAVAQAYVDAAAPSTLTAALDALATGMGTALNIAAFQFNGDTYVLYNADGVAGYLATDDFYVKLSGLVTIDATANLIID